MILYFLGASSSSCVRGFCIELLNDVSKYIGMGLLCQVLCVHIWLLRFVYLSIAMFLIERPPSSGVQENLAKSRLVGFC